MREGEQIFVSHNVTGGPNDGNVVDLQLRLHVFCNKSPLSVSPSPPLLYTFGKMGAAATFKGQRREAFITAIEMMEQTVAFTSALMPTQAEQLPIIPLIQLHSFNSIPFIFHNMHNSLIALTRLCPFLSM